jgi:hypothetical protein
MKLRWKIYDLSLGLIILLATSCNHQTSQKTQVETFVYPDTIIKLGLQESFNNAAWLYFAGTNVHGYGCREWKAKPHFIYSTVENNPVLVNIQLFHDTISLTIGDDRPRDSSQCGLLEDKHYINFWVLKRNDSVVFRNDNL